MNSMIRTVLAASGAGLLAISLAACGSDSDDEDADTDQETTSSAEENTEDDTDSDNDSDDDSDDEDSDDDSDEDDDSDGIGDEDDDNGLDLGDDSDSDDPDGLDSDDSDDNADGLDSDDSADDLDSDLGDDELDDQLDELNEGMDEGFEEAPDGDYPDYSASSAVCMQAMDVMETQLTDMQAAAVEENGQYVIPPEDDIGIHREASDGFDQLAGQAEDDDINEALEYSATWYSDYADLLASGQEAEAMTKQEESYDESSEIYQAGFDLGLCSTQ